MREPDLSSAPLSAAAFDYPGGHVVDRHEHSDAQFLYAAHGILSVTTEAGSWSLTPRSALWLPARAAHEVRAVGPVAMRTAYVRADAGPLLPDRCCVLEVTPLLRELICRAVAFSASRGLAGPRARILQVLEDEIRAAPVAGLPLILPEDDRARAIAEALLADPADARTLEQLSLRATASARTLARLFCSQTGLTFGAWRRRARLLRALELLERGRPVKSIAYSVGYDNAGAFVAMFRRTMKTTPGAWARHVRT